MNTKTHPGLSPGVAIGIGMAAGLTAGLLIAGTRGARLRTEIGESVDGCLAAAGLKLDEIRAEASDLARGGLSEVQRWKDGATAEMKNVVASAVDSSEDGAHKAIDGTVSAVNVAANKGHQAVSNAADSIRTGTNG